MVNKQLLMGAIVSAGLTQKELAEKSGIPLSTLSAKINGHRPFDTVEVASVCRAAGIKDMKLMADIFLLDVTR